MYPSRGLQHSFQWGHNHHIYLNLGDPGHFAPQLSLYSTGGEGGFIKAVKLGIISQIERAMFGIWLERASNLCNTCHEICSDGRG